MKPTQNSPAVHSAAVSLRDYLGETIASAWQPPFRGEIYEDDPPNLQAGYAVKGQFDIHSVRHLIPVFRAIRNPLVLLVSVMAAVQTLKSLLADLTVRYWIKHDPGDTLWLFEDDDKARKYATERFMPMVESDPVIAAMFRGMERFKKNQTRIKFSNMSLTLCGLNLGNVQSISYRYVIFDELWIHKSDGLVRHGKLRTKQYPDTKKILLLGQGGVEDDDADLEHKKTFQLELHYACPKCRALQPFEQSRLRPDDFPISKLRGTYAGLSWDTNSKTKPGDRWDPVAASQTAHHRCFYCDHRIEDLPDVRRQFNDSAVYLPDGNERLSRLALKTPPPLLFKPSMGFHWPAEASTRIPLADLVLEYLNAKNALDTLAYKLPMIEYWQKHRGRPWSEEREAGQGAIEYERYDAGAEWPEEEHRALIVDCQCDLTKFYVSAFGVALDGEARELARETLESFDDIAALQKRLGIRDQYCFFDVGYEMTKVLRECVRHGHVATIKRGNRTIQVWLCWTGLKGSGLDTFKHVVKTKNGTREDHRIYSRKKFYNVNVGTSEHQPRAPWFEWSNLHAKDLLRARRDADPGIPKLLFLRDSLPASDDWSHYRQMRSEKRIEKWTVRGKKAIWELVKESRPNHEWDKCGMLMAFMAIVGIIGAPAADDAEDGS